MRHRLGQLFLPDWADKFRFPRVGDLTLADNLAKSIQSLYRIGDPFRDQWAKLASIGVRVPGPEMLAPDLSMIKDVAAQVGRSTSSLFSIFEQIDQYGSLVALVGQTYMDRVSNDIGAMLAQYNQVVRKLGWSPANPVDAVVRSLATWGELFEKIQPPKPLASQALELTRAYGSFAELQLRRVEVRPEIARAAMTISAGAGELFQCAQQSIQLVMLPGDGDAERDTADDEDPAIAAPLASRTNLFSQVNAYMAWAYRSGVREVTEDDVARSVPGVIAVTGAHITALVCEINRLSEFYRTKSVFPVTRKTMMAASVLPSSVAFSEQRFFDIVEQLFFMLYDNKRLHELSPFGDDVARDLGLIGVLRNFSNHDQQAGRGWEAKKANATKAFQRLTGKPFPISQSDWREAQLALYLLTLGALVKIRERILVEQATESALQN